MSKIETAKIKESWNKRGFSCDLWTDPPGQRWENYVHETDELVIVLEGRVEFEIQHRIFCPAPGEEIFIPAGVKHSVRNVGDVTSRWLYGYQRG